MHWLLSMFSTVTLNSYDSSITTSSRLCSPRTGFPISAILLASSSSTLNCPSGSLKATDRQKTGKNRWDITDRKRRAHPLPVNQNTTAPRSYDSTTRTRTIQHKLWETFWMHVCQTVNLPATMLFTTHFTSVKQSKIEIDFLRQLPLRYFLTFCLMLWTLSQRSAFDPSFSQRNHVPHGFREAFSPSLLSAECVNMRVSVDTCQLIRGDLKPTLVQQQGCVM